jgi:hypothetical protein
MVAPAGRRHGGACTSRYSLAPAVLAAIAVGILALATIRPAWADIDNAELQAKTALRDDKAKAEYLRRIAEEMAEEERREAQLAADAAREEEARRRAEEARPWPERLTEMRCTECHAATHYTDNGHTAAGWWVVALRMRYVNDAPLDWGQKSIIVGYLKEQYPARGIDHIIEWLLIGTALLTIPAGALFGRWYWNRRKRSR